VKLPEFDEGAPILSREEAEEIVREEQRKTLAALREIEQAQIERARRA